MISLIVGIWILSFIIAFVPIYTNIYTTKEFTEGRDPCTCDFVVNEWSVVGLKNLINLVLLMRQNQTSKNDKIFS